MSLSHMDVHAFFSFIRKLHLILVIRVGVVEVHTLTSPHPAAPPTPPAPGTRLALAGQGPPDPDQRPVH